MRRFYRDAASEATDGGHLVTLDERTVRTPDRAILKLPTVALAQAVADEWAAQGEKIDPAAMPLTKLANTAIDRVTGREPDIALDVISFAKTDLVCYRAEAPAELVRRQSAGWDPVLDWAAERYGARLAVTTGVVPVTQSDAVIALLFDPVLGEEAFALTALHVAASVMGSLVLALGLRNGRLGAKEAFGLCEIDEAFQAEQWGWDAEAARRRELRRQELADAARFLALAEADA